MPQALVQAKTCCSLALALPVAGSQQTPCNPGAILEGQLERQSTVMAESSVMARSSEGIHALYQCFSKQEEPRRCQTYKSHVLRPCGAAPPAEASLQPRTALVCIPSKAHFLQHAGAAHL